MLTFFEFCMLLLAIYAFTQLFLPMVFPKDFEYNWIFKKKKPKISGTIIEKVDSLSRQKEELNQATNKVVTETEEQFKQAKDLRDIAKKLK